MKWEKVKIADVCEVVGGTTPSTNRPDYWGEDMVWLSPVDLPEVGVISTVERSQRMITKLALKECGLKVLPPGSLVYSTRASIGKIGIVKTPLVTNQGFTNLIPTERVDVRFLAYTLKFFTPSIEKLGNTTTFKEVSRTAIRNFEIPLPPLPVQKQIADTLDKADALRRKDQELLQKYDELAQSIFYEMFGDPVRNERGWVRQKLGEVTALITKGESPKWQGFDYVDSGVLFLTSENVGWGNLLLEGKTKFIPEDFHRKLKRSKLFAGDVLINLVGASIGRTAIVNDKCIPANINQAVALLRPSERLVSEFLNALLLTQEMQREVKGGIVDAARANISLKNLDELIVIVPPVEEQLRFKTCIESMKKQKDLLRGIPDMFHTLLNRSFS